VRFDTTLRDFLADTPPAVDLRLEHLKRLPGASVYVDTSGCEGHPVLTNGFYACLDHDPVDGSDALLLIADMGGSRGLVPILYPLQDGSVMQRMRKFALHLAGGTEPTGIDLDMIAEDLSSTVAPMLSMIMYLCSDAPDLGDPSDAMLRRGISLTQARYDLPDVRRVKPQLRQVGLLTGNRIRRDAYRHQLQPAAKAVQDNQAMDPVSAMLGMASRPRRGLWTLSTGMVINDGCAVPHWKSPYETGEADLIRV
jgi:hypothetical protein